MMRTSIEQCVYRVTDIIVKTLLTICAIALWLIGIACIWIFPSFAPIPLLLGAVCVLSCKIRPDMGLIVFLCFCPIAIPLAVMQERERKNRDLENKMEYESSTSQEERSESRK